MDPTVCAQSDLTTLLFTVPAIFARGGCCTKPAGTPPPGSPQRFHEAHPTTHAHHSSSPSSSAFQHGHLTSLHPTSGSEHTPPPGSKTASVHSDSTRMTPPSPFRLSSSPSPQGSPQGSHRTSTSSHYHEQALVSPIRGHGKPKSSLEARMASGPGLPKAVP